MLSIIFQYLFLSIIYTHTHIFFRSGGYYTIEQTKSRLRIIALNTNLMRHDTRMSQSNSAASRQRVGSSSGSSSRNSNEYDEHYRSYHHGYHYRSNGINGYSTNEHGSGGTVSALSGANESHETQRQWEWLEDVLAKSQRNGETVRLSNIFFFYLPLKG